MKNSLNQIKSQEVFTKDGFTTSENFINRIGKDYTLEGYVEYVFVKSAYENFLNAKENADQKLVKNVTEKLLLLTANSDSLEKRINVYKECKAVVKFLALQKSLCSAKKSKKAKRPETIQLRKNGENIICSKNDSSVVDSSTVEVLVNEFFAQRSKTESVKKEKPHEAIARFMYEKDLSPADVCRATIYYETEMSHQDFHQYILSV